MKKVMLVGPVGAGKTSLIKALNQDDSKAGKTNSICFYDGAIDTPGEYCQIPRFYSALLVTAVEAEVVLIVQDAADCRPTLPPGFAGMFSRPLVGVVTKIDLPHANREKAQECLREVGVTRPIFFVSAITGEGLIELSNYLVEGGCKYE
ncbi:EutP/PduV family microcompartment system protein [Dendrosporobacter sp. 1207_IL3150]|uniref:EutP/PduV family microcompartment system protein n=1 Tax=Dendrosporobacter sp. 1207_IL3150 TaxID=3084054 RepID=UPI002FD914E8